MPSEHKEEEKEKRQSYLKESVGGSTEHNARIRTARNFFAALAARALGA